MENKTSIKDLTNQVAELRQMLEKADSLIKAGTAEAAKELDALAREIRYHGAVIGDMAYKMGHPRV